MDYTDLEKLYEMKQKGVISETEFEEKKKAFLESIPGEAEFVFIDPETGEVINPAGNLPDSDEEAGADASLPMFTPQTYPKKGLFRVYLNAFKKIFRIKGRASRYDYWGFWFINTIIALIFAVLMYFMANAFGTSAETDLEKSVKIPVLIFGGFSAIFYSLYSIIIIPVSLTLFIRRLHDIGKSGWQIILLPLKVILSLALAAILFALLGAVMQYSGTLSNAMGRPIWTVIGFLSIFGTFLITVLIFFIWQCKKGNATANRFGTPVMEDPKYDRIAKIFIVLFFVISFIAGVLEYNTREKFKTARDSSQVRYSGASSSQAFTAGAISGYQKAMAKYKAQKEEDR